MPFIATSQHRKTVPEFSHHERHEECEEQEREKPIHGPQAPVGLQRHSKKKSLQIFWFFVIFVVIERSFPLPHSSSPACSASP
jgi:hypothetical protein